MQYVLDFLMWKYNAKPFYEYYFEPNGKDGTVFFQFLHDNLKQGLQAKKRIESLFTSIQYILMSLIFLGLLAIILNYRFSGFFLFIVLLVLFTRILNPISYNMNQLKSIKNKNTYIIISLIVIFISLYKIN